jgi:DNA-binding CsgD family transcriptional regulator
VRGSTPSRSTWPCADAPDNSERHHDPPGRKRPATGWASLTPAELEVARLAGEGLRNDAIARGLFIAPGTVKVHLSHIFAKLGITTRAELAAQAAAHDLTAR